MTDARFPERWLNDRRFNRLTDAAYRTYAMALIWSVANRTDGQLDDADIQLIPRYSNESVRTLESEGLWERCSTGWLIVDFPDTQTSRDELVVLENNRRRVRDKKRRQRAAVTSNDEHVGSRPSAPGGGPDGHPPVQQSVRISEDIRILDTCPGARPGGHENQPSVKPQLRAVSRGTVLRDNPEDTTRPGQDKARTGHNPFQHFDFHSEDEKFLNWSQHAG